MSCDVVIVCAGWRESMRTLATSPSKRSISCTLQASPHANRFRKLTKNEAQPCDRKEVISKIKPISDRGERGGGWLHTDHRRTAHTRPALSRRGRSGAVAARSPSAPCTEASHTPPYGTVAAASNSTTVKLPPSSTPRASMRAPACVRACVLT
jgi:hypothetical protein